MGFELSLYARVPTDVPPGSEGEAAFEALWDRLRGIAESLVPLAGKDARIEVDPFEAAARLRPETQFAPEVLLSARLFHGSDLLAPVRPRRPGAPEAARGPSPELGLKARSW